MCLPKPGASDDQDHQSTLASRSERHFGALRVTCATLAGMGIVRVALVVLAVVAVAMGLLMMVGGEPLRGVAVMASAAGPLWLSRYLRGGQDQTGPLRR